MMIKLIVSDLDGTLLHSHTTIRDEDREALHEARRQGLAVAFASGRMLPEIRDIMERMELNAHAISQNGAYVHTAEGQLIRHHVFDRELILSLAEAAADTPFVTVLAGPDRYIVKHLDEKAARLRQRLLAPLVEIEDLNDQLGKELLCGKISYMGDIAGLRRLREQLLEAYGDAIDAYISDSDCLDVMPRASSKGTGLIALLDDLDVKPEEVLCIGDAFNDISMFAVTPHSFAMASSHAEVQAHASHTVRFVSDAVRWAMGQTV